MNECKYHGCIDMKYSSGIGTGNNYRPEKEWSWNRWERPLTILFWIKPQTACFFPGRWCRSGFGWSKNFSTSGRSKPGKRCWSYRGGALCLSGGWSRGVRWHIPPWALQGRFSKSFLLWSGYCACWVLLQRSFWPNRSMFYFL